LVEIVARHTCCYRRWQLIALLDHYLPALFMNRHLPKTTLEQAFDALGSEPREFHLCLKRQPVKTGIHLRCLLGLAHICGSAEVLAALARVLGLAVYDAAHIENLLLAKHQHQQLPTHILPVP
jgi:hypothetical protein